MGVSTVTAQALSAPPYLVAFVVVLWSAYASDKRGARSPYIIFFAALASAGYLLIVLSGLFNLPSWIRYFSLYPACMGFFACVTLIITWTLNNQDSESKKGTGIAVLQFFGQCGPLLGTRLFPAEDGPLYTKGMAVCAAFMAGVGFLAFSLRTVLRRENEKRWKLVMSQDSQVPPSGEDVEAPLVGGDPSLKGSGTFMYIL